MEKDQIRTLTIGTLVLILVAFLLSAQFSQEPNQGFADNAKILAMITALAVGIERLIELFWTVVGMTKGSWWPLGLINEQMGGLVKGLDEQFQAVSDDALATMKKLEKDGELVEKRSKEAKKELDALKSQIKKFQELAPNNTQINLAAATTFQGINYLSKKYPEYIKTVDVANQAIAGVADIMASIKDNPGRRLISICLGVILGMLFASFVGLDIFMATLGTTISGSASILPYLGVALTGLVIGLGSNPTHEVIRVLQEYKKDRKLDNSPAPSIPLLGNGGTIRVRGSAGRGVQAPSSEISTFSLRRR